VDEFHYTEDGQFFIEKKYATNHASGKKLKVKTIGRKTVAAYQALTEEKEVAPKESEGHSASESGEPVQTQGAFNTIEDASEKEAPAPAKPATKKAAPAKKATSNASSTQTTKA